MESDMSEVKFVSVSRFANVHGGHDDVRKHGAQLRSAGVGRAALWTAIFNWADKADIKAKRDAGDIVLGLISRRLSEIRSDLAVHDLRWYDSDSQTIEYTIANEKGIVVGNPSVTIDRLSELYAELEPTEEDIQKAAKEAVGQEISDLF